MLVIVAKQWKLKMAVIYRWDLFYFNTINHLFLGLSLLSFYILLVLISSGPSSPPSSETEQWNYSCAPFQVDHRSRSFSRSYSRSCACSRYCWKWSSPLKVIHNSTRFCCFSSSNHDQALYFSDCLYKVAKYTKISKLFSASERREGETQLIRC